MTGSGGTPSGSVTFLDGTNVIGTATLTASGTAILSISTLPLGPHSLTANYTGDANDAASTSAPVVLTIQKETVTVSIASNNNPSLGGLQVTFTAALQSQTGTPTGTIAWTDGTTLIATTPVTVTGASTYTTSSLVPGQHSITATYSGDSTNSSATSNPIVETIQQANSALTLISSKNPAIVGDVVTYSVAVTGTGGQPGGNVTIKDGASVIGTITLDANGLGSLASSSLAVGNHTLTAVYAGDSYHSGSQSLPLSQLILQGSASTLTSSNNPSLGGAPVTFTATVVVSGSQPVTGTVTFKDGTTVLGVSPVNSSNVAIFATSSLATGQHSITASYSGDSFNQASISPVLVQTVQTASTTTTLSSSANPSTVGSTTILTAQVNGSGATPTGTVNFQDGSTVLGSSPVGAGGVATLSTSSLTAGQHILLAIYQGDADHVTSTSNPLLQSVQQRTTIALSSNLNPSLAANNVVFSVTVSNGANTAPPTGTVSLMDGSTLIGTAVLSATGTASFTISSLAVGQHSVSAVYGGDSQNFTSTSSPLIESVKLHASTNVLTTSSDILTATSASGASGQQVSLVATLGGDGPVAPTGSVVFSSGTTTLGTATINASGVATLTVTLTPGTYNVVSIYQGRLTLYRLDVGFGRCDRCSAFPIHHHAQTEQHDFADQATQQHPADPYFYWRIYRRPRTRLRRFASSGNMHLQHGPVHTACERPANCESHDRYWLATDRRRPCFKQTTGRRQHRAMHVAWRIAACLLLRGDRGNERKCCRDCLRCCSLPCQWRSRAAADCK